MDEPTDEPLDPLGDLLNDPLSYVSLFEGAGKFAWSALEAHARKDMEVFLLHAGVSIERLAKAALAQKSPFLLMEMKGKDDTLYHLTGVRQTDKLRTIGASQAIRRLRDMTVLPPSDPDLDELIELRNGVAHLMASVSEEFDGLTVFCQVTNHLLDHLGESHLRACRSLTRRLDLVARVAAEGDDPGLDGGEGGGWRGRR
jgi:hypothetical protein